MAGAYRSSQRRPSGAERWRRDALRRKRYGRRRLVALLCLLAVAIGGYYARDGVAKWWSAPRAAAPEIPTEPLPFQPERLIEAGDLNGDGTPEHVAVSHPANFFRQIALVTGKERSYQMIGKAVNVEDFELEIRDLPRSKGVLVLSGRLPATGQPKEEQVGGAKALRAAGGEPTFRAWQLDPMKGLLEADFYALSAPLTPANPDQIIVDKWLNVLWYYEKGELVHTFRVATGRHLTGPAPTAQNQAHNFVTPLGKFQVTNKVERPHYYKENISAGDPRNPLGTRFLGYSVYAGDGANVWAIHGTDKEETIGQWISDGCIRLKNADVEKLFERVKEGTVLEVVKSGGS